MRKVGLLSNANRAFLPSVEANRRFLSSQGYTVVDMIEFPENIDEYVCIFISFGFYPFWSFNRGAFQGLLIGDYLTLSTGRFPKVKNIIKSLLNIRCDKYVVNVEAVVHGYPHLNGGNVIFRPQGFFAPKFRKVQNMDQKKFDIVYAGSLNRKGVRDAIVELARANLSVIVVGNTEADKAYFHAKNCDLVTCAGRKTVEDTQEILSRARIGLNYIPDVYPFTIQDSTKVLEYLGVGLTVLSNRYNWIEEFRKKYDIEVLWLDEFLRKPNEFKNVSYKSQAQKVADLSWDKLMLRSGILELLDSIDSSASVDN